MSCPIEHAGLKRKRAAPNPVADADGTVLNVIKSKKGMGIWIRDLKRETKLAENVMKKSITSLLGKKMIKDVVNVNYGRKKHYMASEFEASEEISGGVWYNEEGKIDKELIDGLKKLFLRNIQLQKVVTADKFSDMLNDKKALKFKCTKDQIEEILKSMVLDDQIKEVMKDGEQEYRALSNDAPAKTGAMASIPCGVCPRFSQCTVDGIISPTTCVYYKNWLDF